MNKSKLITILLVAAALLAATLVHAKSDEQVRAKKVAPIADSDIKAAPTSPSQMPTFTGTRQGYQMVIEVLNSFGGQSESDNYRIPVNSGGQSAAIGISQSDSFVVKAGFVHASYVNRGDANSDGAIGAGDIVYLLNYLFRADEEPCPMESGDANCSGAVEAGDVVYLISYLYRGGPPPAC
jgi:hypothetical protein